MEGGRGKEEEEREKGGDEEESKEEGNAWTLASNKWSSIKQLLQYKSNIINFNKETYPNYIKILFY